MLFMKVLKLGIVASTATGTLVVLQRNDWNVSSIGVVRLGRAATTVASIALDYQFSLPSNVDKSSVEYKELKSKIHLRSANKLLKLCSTNGGVFIKVGQHVGALNYLLPQEYTSTLSVLHNHAPQSPINDIYQVLKEEFNIQDLGEMFDDFQVEPIGAASLAQVHKAKLKDGSIVAVKVQHKKVRAHSFVDIQTMDVLVNMVAWLFPDFSFLWLAEQMKTNLPLELDFVNEGRNAEKVEKMFSKFSWLKIPEIFWEMTTKRVLTMEYCEGGDVNNKQYMIDNNIPVDQISEQLGRLYSEMIFVQGYVHCDPHPGNILVQKSSKGKTNIILLDHGLYTNLTDRFRLQYCRMWMALLQADVQGIKDISKELGVGNLYGILACMMSARSWTAVTKGIKKNKTTAAEIDKIKDFVAGHIVDIADVLNKVPREMILIFKTNDLLRGIEAALGIQGAANSFVTMSKCCVTAVADHKLKHCETVLGRTKIRWSKQMSLLRITILQILMRLRNSITNSWILRKVISQ